MEKWLKDEKTTHSAASKYHIKPMANKYPFLAEMLFENFEKNTILLSKSKS